MRVRFWGTRGSIASAGPDTVRYGGNTSGVEVCTRGGTLIVLDAGTGIRMLGDALLVDKPAALRGHIFITHTHWDHIQGFPFFAPLFVSGKRVACLCAQGVRPIAEGNARRADAVCIVAPIASSVIGK